MSKSKFIVILSLFFVFVLSGCGNPAPVTNIDEYPIDKNTEQTFSLSENAIGHIEFVDNIQNLTIVSKDENDLKAEYNAGFIQGKLQKPYMISCRDNLWDIMNLIDPRHTFDKQQPPAKEVLEKAQNMLLENYTYTIEFIKKSQKDLSNKLGRIIFRLLGVYHGTALQEPLDNIDFTGNWIPEVAYFKPSELALNYETANISWIDIYYLNAFVDIVDVLSFESNIKDENVVSKCSAFVKKTGDNIFIAHNSWFGYLSQTMAINYMINGDFLTFNAIYPGVISSLTDFGYNNKGLMFIETTHHYQYTQPKIKALWMFVRAAAAEQYSSNFDEFFKYISLDNSGTYLNGYLMVDAKTKEIGLIEMSYSHFALYKPNGYKYDLTITPVENTIDSYDQNLVQKDYILGINYPASYQIRNDLIAIEAKPGRTRQFIAQIKDVVDIESAKALIAYTDNENPISINGRWDLGYGETPKPKTVAEGTIDDKATSMDMALKAMKLEGKFDLASSERSFWMKYGTAYINGQPFIWSQSFWRNQKLRNVPDKLDGRYRLLKTYIK